MVLHDRVRLQLALPQIGFDLIEVLRVKGRVRARLNSGVQGLCAVRLHVLKERLTKLARVARVPGQAEGRYALGLDHRHLRDGPARLALVEEGVFVVDVEHHAR